MESLKNYLITEKLEKTYQDALDEFLKDTKELDWKKEDGTFRYYIKSKKAKEIEIRVQLSRGDAWSRIPRAISTASEADKYPVVLQILDSRTTESLLDDFKKAGCHEANRYRNSQWGTWKIVPDTPEDLEKIGKILMDWWNK